MLQGPELSRFVAKQNWKEYRDFRHRLHGSSETLSSERTNLKVSNLDFNFMGMPSAEKQRAYSTSSSTGRPRPSLDDHPVASMDRQNMDHQNTDHQNTGSDSTLLSVVSEKSYENSAEDIGWKPPNEVLATKNQDISSKNKEGKEEVKLPKLVDISYPKVPDYSESCSDETAAAIKVAPDVENCVKNSTCEENANLISSNQNPQQMSPDVGQVSMVNENQPLLQNSWLKPAPASGQAFWREDNRYQERHSEEQQPLLSVPTASSCVVGTCDSRNQIGAWSGTSDSHIQQDGTNVDTSEGCWKQDAAGEWIWIIGKQPLSLPAQTDTVPVAWHGANSVDCSSSSQQPAAWQHVTSNSDSPNTQQSVQPDPSPSGNLGVVVQQSTAWNAEPISNTNVCSVTTGDSTDEGQWIYSSAFRKWIWIHVDRIGKGQIDSLNYPEAEGEQTPAITQSQQPQNWEQQHNSSCVNKSPTLISFSPTSLSFPQPVVSVTKDGCHQSSISSPVMSTLAVQNLADGSSWSNAHSQSTYPSSGNTEVSVNSSDQHDGAKWMVPPNANWVGIIPAQEYTDTGQQSTMSAATSWQEATSKQMEEKATLLPENLAAPEMGSVDRERFSVTCIPKDAKMNMEPTHTSVTQVETQSWLAKSANESANSSCDDLSSDGQSTISSLKELLPQKRQ